MTKCNRCLGQAQWWRREEGGTFRARPRPRDTSWPRWRRLSCELLFNFRSYLRQAHDRSQILSTASHTSQLPGILPLAILGRDIEESLCRSGLSKYRTDKREKTSNMSGRHGGRGGGKVLLPPINAIFQLLQRQQKVSIWLYEQLGMRIEGTIKVQELVANLQRALYTDPAG